MTAARPPGRLLGRFRRDRAGAAAVEFVAVLPLLALLLFGVVDLGRLLTDYQAAQASVRDATRYLARADPVALGIDCAAGAIDESSPAALAAMRLAMTGTTDGSGDYVLGYWTDMSGLAAAGITVSVSCTDNGTGALAGLYRDLAAVPSLRMRAAIAFPLLNGWLLERGGTMTFTVQHRQPHVGGGWGI